MKKVKTNTLENTTDMYIITCRYARNIPCSTLFYVSVPFALHVISTIYQ